MTNTSHPSLGLPQAHKPPFAAGKYVLRRLVMTSCACVFAGIGMAFAAPPPQAAPPAKPAAVPRSVIVQPSANAQLQQKMQQAQMRSQLQQAQVEQQNHQALSQNLMRPYANNPQLKQQTDQVDAQRQRIDRARQQSIIDRYNATPPPSPVIVPLTPPPAKPAGGG